MDADKSSVSLKRQPLDPDKMFAALEDKIKNSGVETVSYTHLTLPTICSV